MPKGAEWSLTKLSKIATFTNGGAWKASEYVKTGIPVVRVSDCKNDTVDLSMCKYLSQSAKDKYSKHEITTGDLIIATVGSHPKHPASVVGRPIIVPQTANGAYLNQNAVCVRPLEGSLNKRYLSYLAKAPDFREYIIARAQGSANQVRIAISLLKEMPINLPPLPTQQKIATILSSYDELIENNTRRIEILEEMAQALYREWFVEFRFPGHEDVKMVEAEDGRMVPEGWEIKKIEDLCDFISRGITPKYESGSERFIINQKANEGSKINYSNLKELKSGLFVPETKFARTGDLLINCLGEGTIGRTHLFLYPDNEWAVDQHMSICRSENNAITTYLFFILASPEGQAIIQTLKSGGTNMTTFNISSLRSLKVYLPSEEILNQFYDQSWTCFKLKGAIQRKNDNLRQTRDLILPRLIEGEIDVSDLEIQIENYNNC